MTKSAEHFGIIVATIRLAVDSGRADAAAVLRTLDIVRARRPRLYPSVSRWIEDRAYPGTVWADVWDVLCGDAPDPRAA